MNADRIGMALLAALLTPPPAAAQGFAGLGEESPGFLDVSPGAAFDFPADHGAHPGYRIEWWYVTANLTGPDGTAYGVQWTLFRNALTPGPERAGWASQQLWMGHAALTTADDHRYAETLARGGIGQAGVAAAPFSAAIDDWALAASGDAPTGIAGLDMRAAGGDFGFALHLSTEMPPVPQGDGGFSVKSVEGQASYYYSQPFYEAAGTLVLDGEEIPVTGAAWLDREWSSQPLAEGQEGWDWFSLHLATGEKVMLFQLRDDAGGAYRSGTWIAADGTPTPLGSDDIALTPGETTDVAGRTLPTHWSIAVPAHGFAAEVVPLNPASWMGTSIAYWEGPIGLSGDQGVGYLEMTGY